MSLRISIAGDMTECVNISSVGTSIINDYYIVMDMLPYLTTVQ